MDYQIGITYERLLQPEKAIDTYNQILSHEAALGTNASPGLKAVFDMARWRRNFLEWQNKAETSPVSGRRRHQSTPNRTYREMNHESDRNL